ncbi:hypothetical protein ABMA28_011259 [Loxostege sticticalis]|uniref:Enhancer of polycomb-like protein n=1 Tax=Loxostege sticticalis TaxID=481309 RepID=A0ABD0S922_LOXSC
MQTRKNRKNDESSYEKMLKLRRDLARALTLLELVARRETAKRELVRLTATLAERRYAAGDFANQLLPDPPPRPSYPTVPLTTSSFRAYSAPHYPPRAPPTPQDIPRQREKRSYKKRKPRHPAVGTVPGLRAALGSSSDEESTRPEAPPVDDGPFAFRRKPGCYYEMPTSTLCGDPVDPDRADKEALYDHELDERNRFTLTSLNHPYPHCVGFARRRVGRGGRVLLDRVRTPLDDLWRRLPFPHPSSSDYQRERAEEVEFETKAHRTPKEMNRDYHTSGKHPWRHAFRQHLSRHPDLWTEVKPEAELKPELDIKLEFDAEMCEFNAYKVSDTASDTFKVDSDNKDSETISDTNCRVSRSDSVTYRGVGDGSEARTIECNVKESLSRAMRKRAWSGCSDTSYDSDESLQPVEKEFEKFITEVNKKWLHFRPKTPPPSPPSTPHIDDTLPIALDTPIAVELRSHPSENLEPFTTSEFTLSDLYGDINPEEKDNSGSSLDISGEDLLNENFTGLTEAQVESILSETDLKALVEDDKKLPEDLLELVTDERDPFLLRGQGSDGRAGSGLRKRKADAFGSTAVQVSPLAKETMYVEALRSPPALIETPKVKDEKPPPPPAPHVAPPPAPTTTALDDLPPVKLEKARDETIEEVQLPRGVQLQTVQTAHSPLKKHIITSAAHRRASDSAQAQAQDTQPPQLLAVAVSDSLKVRLQNHLLSSQAGVLVQNGPFPPVAVAVPVQQARDTNVAGVSVGASTSSPRRVSAPLVHLAPAALSHKPLQIHPPHSQPLVVAQSHTIHHVAPNKLKVLHAHPLTQTQRTQLLAQNRSIAQLPAVVSLAPLGEAKTTNTAAPGSVAQFFEIKSGQLGKGPHLVNVVRQPQPAKPAQQQRLELGAGKKRQVVSLEGAALKGQLAAAGRPQRVSLSLDGRPLVRAALPAVRAQHLRHQIQLKNRTTLQVATPIARSSTEPTSSIAAIPTSKTASIPSAVVASLLQQTKNVQLPKSGQKIAISGPGGQALSANVQAIAFTTAQLKARQARLVQPRHAPRPEIVEAGAVPAASPSTARADGAEPDAEPVRRRAADTLPMEVT